MKPKAYFKMWRDKFITGILFLILSFAANAQSTEDWYSTAQQRIDTLRKGNFGIKITDKNGQPFTGDVSVRMAKHEFPFGIAFDLYEGAVNNGNTYSTTASISAPVDAEIYKSERYYSFIAYAIPVEKERNYKLTLKFAEIYYSNAGARIFDVFVEGTKFLSNFDMFAEAGGKNIAVDTTINITATDSIINIELAASVDNAAIKGIEIQTVEGDWITRINCGGGELTTTDGHLYKSDVDFFDLKASRYPTQEQWAKAAMQKYFNYGASGNSFKWSGIQPQHTTPNYTNFDNAVNWTKSIDWELRAHTLLWGADSDHEMPAWVRQLPTPQAITDTCKMRVTREMTRYKGIIKEYDVINEPLTNHADWLRNTVGDSILWNCFKWAHAADPDAKLYINDYNVEFNWGQAVEYRDLILKIKEMGGPVSGVGIQAHFWDCCRPNVDELVKNLNIVAEAGLPMRLTEYDWGTNLTEQQQVNDFMMVATIAFSHPSVNGMICWGLSDNGVWRENTGFFDANHRPKLAADTLLYLTKKLWATNFDSAAAGDAAMLFDAYYGNYTVEVKFGDTVKVFTIPCIKANEDSVFVLNENDAAIKGPVLITAKLLSDTSLTLVFDKPVQPESIVNGDFKFFSDNPLRIQDIEVDTNDSLAVNITLQDPITPNNYLSVSYFPGSLSSTDGGKAMAFGPETIDNLTTGLISATVTNDGYNIEALFNANIQNLDENLTSFAIVDNGQPVSISNLDYKENDSTILVFTFTAPLTSASKPTIKYTKGTLKPSNGFVCQSSPVIAVSNFWPKLVKAEVNSTGNQLSALFNTKLQNVEDNAGSFSIAAEGNLLQINQISESGTDSSKVVFKLEGSVSKGYEVLLSYQPGTIKGLNGNSLETINNAAVTNNSTLSGIETPIANNLVVYPNPASDKIEIIGSTDSYSVSIFNNVGTLVYKTQSSSENITINVGTFQRGIYLIQTLDKNGNISMGKIVLN